MRIYDEKHKGAISCYTAKYSNDSIWTGRICNYIPMETYLDQPISINDEIPIFAVTGGICGAMDFMGMPMFTQDYCGLRDKHQHPKEWVNIENVFDYCFYTIEFH